MKSRLLVIVVTLLLLGAIAGLAFVLTPKKTGLTTKQAAVKMQTAFDAKFAVRGVQAYVLKCLGDPTTVDGYYCAAMATNLATNQSACLVVSGTITKAKTDITNVTSDQAACAFSLS